MIDITQWRIAIGTHHLRWRRNSNYGLTTLGEYHSGGSRMGHLGQMPPPPSFKKLHTRSIYSNRAVNYSNKAVTMFMRQCSLPMKLQIGFYFT